MRPLVPALVCTIAGAACSEPTAAPECLPAGGGPYWIEEGETVAFTVICATGAEPDGTALVIAPMPAGASWDPAAARFTWTPALDQAAVIDLRLTVGLESSTVTVGVADAFDAPGNLPVADPTAYPLEFGLPVLFLQPAPATTSAAPVDVIYRGERYSGAEGELRGAASLGYPKNSYDLHFGNNKPFREPELGGGMVRRRIVLLSTFDDNSQVRQRLAYDLWNAIDPAHIQVRSFHAVVYLDGVYHGLYLITDHVDADLVAAHGLSADGDLFKAIDHDANFRLTDYQGNPKATLHQGYEKKEGEPPDDFTALDDLVQWAANVAPADFAGQRGARLDAGDYDDWWIFVTLLQ
ncbi:MAG TPA: CotH kinase family protein, partial [Kofleriaceae bacterium]|nr:CotH kinase family protein [Kofleriaceae bacterium]